MINGIPKMKNKLSPIKVKTFMSLMTEYLPGLPSDRNLANGTTLNASIIKITIKNLI